MMRREISVYQTNKGMSIVDPGFDCLPFIKKIMPNFKIESFPPMPGFMPSFQKTRTIRISGLAIGDLQGFKTENLWKMHERIIKGDFTPSKDIANPTILDLKIELARREIEHCLLCGWNCGADRFKKSGRCGLMNEAYYNSLYIHVAEEPVITPSAVVKLSGCGLRCIFCQAHESFNTEKGQVLDSNLWKELHTYPDFSKAISLQFVGGNPDESLFAILKCLKAAPDSLRLPIVWNNNGYATGTLYKLSEGVVDVWLTDYKYANDECAGKLSGIENYVEVAKEGVKHIVSQEAKAIIRILLLPGHLNCCHRKILEWLSDFTRRIWVSIIDNYLPAWKALNHPEINRMVSDEEISEAKALLKSYGLRDISECSKDFWEKVE